MIAFLLNYWRNLSGAYQTDRDFVFLFAIIVAAFFLAMILAGVPETVPYDDDEDDVPPPTR